MPGQRRVLGGALALVAAAAGCVSVPEAVGPTALAGSLPSPAAGAGAGAARVPGGADGPLLLLEPRFRWLHASETGAVYAWQCRVENPWHTAFLVTVVVQILDGDGRPLDVSTRAFRLEGDDDHRAQGTGTLEADAVGRASQWRIEYWVRLPERPAAGAAAYSHSMVAGGLVETS